jgi:hypothetical protein
MLEKDAYLYLVDYQIKCPMRYCTHSLLFLFICTAIVAAAQVDTTVLSWQAMPQPPVPVTSLARQGDRLFAGTDSGLYYSDDLGESWQQHPEFRTKVNNVSANAQGVIVERFVQGTVHSFIVGFAWYYIYRSADGGQTFGPHIREVNAGFVHYGGYGSTRVQRVNESAFCYSADTYSPGNNLGNIHFSYNGGAEWEVSGYQNVFDRAPLFVSGDTVIFPRNLSSVDRRPASDLHQVETDSLNFPTGLFSSLLELRLMVFRNNRYYIYDLWGRLLVNDSPGGSWKINPVNLPQGTRSYTLAGDYVYARIFCQFR